jgi:BMFP domain-containing protein YqiC
VAQLRRQLASLEARLQALEVELRELRAGDRRAAATSGEAPPLMTTAEFVERYRDAVREMIVDARAEQAWLDRRIELGTWAYNLVSDLKLPKETGPISRSS